MFLPKSKDLYKNTNFQNSSKVIALKESFPYYLQSILWYSLFSLNSFQNFNRDI